MTKRLKFFSTGTEISMSSFDEPRHFQIPKSLVKIVAKTTELSRLSFELISFIAMRDVFMTLYHAVDWSFLRNQLILGSKAPDTRQAIL